MGIETILFAGFTALRTISQISAAEDEAKNVKRNAEAQARALRDEGQLRASERAKELRLRSARQTSSFLSSGLTLEGTPGDVLDETFDVGIADIKNIGKSFQTNINNVISDANAQSKSIIARGRSEAISTIVGSASNFSTGNLFSAGGITVPFTGSGSFVNDSGLPVPGNKPARINF